MKSSNIKYLLKVSLLVVNIFVTTFLNAQFFSFGNDPGRLKWDYIRVDKFRVIYPREIDSVARRYAWLLDTLEKPVHMSLDVRTSPIDVVLHPYSAMSNGMVGWAPSRMELITTPPANDHYVNDWDKHLVIHELRHVGQVSKFKRGIFKPLGWLIGEQAAALGTGLFMSQWKLEGDAIVSETELTSGGRGRDPDHLIYYKAAFLEGDYRNWNHWTMGSYKEFVPSPYSFGYLYTSFVRYNSNNYNYMGQVTDYIVSRFYDLNAQGKGYLKYTGLSKRGNYEAMKEFYTTKWREEDSARAPFVAGKEIVQQNGPIEGKGNYQSYIDPFLYEGEIYAIKKSLDNIPGLVRIDKDGNEKLLRNMGSLSSPLKLWGSKVYWTEYVVSARWDLESYSDLFCYDMESGKSERLTTRHRIFNPGFSLEGDTLAAVSYNVQGDSHLVLYKPTGDGIIEISNLDAPQGYRLKEAVFVKGGIVASVVRDGGMVLFRTSLPFKGSWELFANPQGYIISNLYYDRESGKILFVSDYNGVKNLYEMEGNGNSFGALTNVRFGLNGFFKENGLLLLSDFSKWGYSIKRMEYNPDYPKENNFSSGYKYDIAEKLSKEASLNADSLEVPPAIGYVSKPYSKVKNLFRIHSWAPVFYDVDNIKNLTYESVYDLVSPGFILYSQNSLSTAYSMAGYSWQNGRHTGHFKFSYHGLYPVVELESSINTRDRLRMTTETDGLGFTHVDVEELAGSPLLRAGIRVYLPMTWSVGGWSSGVVPRAFWRFTNDSFFSVDRERYSYYQYGNVGLSLFRVMNRSQRDIFPKKGGGASLLFSAVPFSGENFGSLLYGSGYYYFPGFVQGHGVKFSVAAQKQFAQGKNYLMSNSIRFPHGYQDRFSKSAVSVSGEYAMPLFTGDISLTEMLYIKRIQMIPFASYCSNEGQLGREQMWSAGSDLLLDLNLLGISYPLVVGVRGGLNGDKKGFVEFLFKTPL